MDIFDAAERYKTENRPTIILAGKDYGSGSSRDWAAKGPWMQVTAGFTAATLLDNNLTKFPFDSQGIKAVIAQSFERIHRSNLVGMGIIPLEFMPDQNADTLGLTGMEFYTIMVPEDLKIGMVTDVKVSLIP